MTQRPRAYSDPQLKTLEILQRNLLAKVMFIFLLTIFTVLLGFILYALFWRQSSTATAVLLGMIGLDGLLGWSIKQIVTFLFPTPGTPQNQSSSKTPQA